MSFPNAATRSPAGPPKVAAAGVTRAWDAGHFAVLMRSRLIIPLIVVPLAVPASVLSGYAFATMRFRGKSAPGLCASAIIVMSPVIVVHPFTQRHFVRGMLEGAVK